MSLFQKWLRVREDMDSAADQFKFDSEDDFADDYEHVQQELFKAVMSKYPQETMQFLDGVAQRGDSEIAELLNKLNREKGPSSSRPPQHRHDPDEVVPAVADRGHSDSGE